MKSLLTIAVSVLLLSFLAAPDGVENRKDHWKKVDEAIGKGLSKTAIEHLKPIIRGAMSDGAHAEAVKAIAQKIVLEGNIQGNKPEEKISRMRIELAKAPKEMVPVMEAILAHWYWHYFQQNRWRFMRRTATAEPPGEDFTTWDLPRLFAEIDKHFTAALSAEAILKETPVSEFDALLVKGNMPDTYRPTMFDFLAYDALAFYTAGEQAAARSQDAFDLLAASPIFAPVEDFRTWEIKTTDERSPAVKAIRLYQNLLKTHQNDDDRSAFLDANLYRLRFGHNKAFGEEKKPRYIAALKRFIDRAGDHKIAARAIHQWARILRIEGKLVESRETAQRGAKRWAESVGGRQCHNLIHQIEAKSYQVSTERVWNDPWPAIDVRYRNFEKIHFRAVRYDWRNRLNSSDWRPENLNRLERVQLLARKPDLSWSEDLPATDDFQERSLPLPSPKHLKPGFYYLVASVDDKFLPEQNQVTFTHFWVSRLSLVTRIRNSDGRLGGFVLDAKSGDPIPGSSIHAWYRDRKGKRIAVPPTSTDKQGLFSLPVRSSRSYFLLAKHEDQELATARDYSNHSHTPQHRFQRTIFFTDRSLYRPGQTIQYKGIAMNVDQRANNYETLAGHQLTVSFLDVNRKKIADAKHRTNDNGSFSGSFTAPRDRLMGRMRLQVASGPSGTTHFNVEEYKRPKFQVTLDAPEEATRLGGKVQLEGRETAYTGAAIGGAKIRYRVVREVRYPMWWGWCYWWRSPASKSQEIAHGSATTGADGRFLIEFVARPDLSVPEKEEPTFVFKVHADVTDISGETRSAQRLVNVGYTALRATLSANSWLTSHEPVSITVRTETLDGVAEAATGLLRIYRLTPPKKVQRPHLAGHRRYSLRRGDAPPADRSNPNSWPLGEVVSEQEITTDANGMIAVPTQLQSGSYRAILETQDRFGKQVTAQLPLRILNPKAQRFDIKIPFLLEASNWTVEPGERLEALWGTGYEKARAFIEIEHRGKSLSSFWTHPDKTQVSIRPRITEALRGGFTVRVTMVRENRAYLQSRRVNVPWTNKKLKIRWEHFVSKLAPGKKETWTAVVTGPDAKRAVAEMIATLYDASLDAYLPHHWQRGLGVFYQDHSRLRSQFENTMHQANHLHGRWNYPHKDGSIRYRSFPDNLTMNFSGYQRSGRMKRRFGGGGGIMLDSVMSVDEESSRAPTSSSSEFLMFEAKEKIVSDSRSGIPGSKRLTKGSSPQIDLSQVTARKNLNETAFFLPHLLASKNGEVKLEFTMPEALTEWKLFGFAHDSDLRSGFIEDKAVTSKDLMVEPNPPRFVREGDAIELTVKVTNQSAARQTGTVRLTLSDAVTNESRDAELGNSAPDLAFDVPSKESRSYSWKLAIPDGAGVLVYKAVGSTGPLSDGEEGFLPVLSRRILVTESLPLPIRGAKTKQFDFAKLRASGESDTLRHERLTVQMVSNPSWYAVMALPYLMEYPYACTEQTFNRLYANALARHIAASDPKIRRIFDIWKDSPAPAATLKSPLEKNEDLKAVLLEETPWLRQAKRESEARRNVGILFDKNRLDTETARLVRKMAELQHHDGAWPWFPGGRANDYITLYITTGFGRMRHLGVEIDTASAVKALGRLDGWIDKIYREILARGHKDRNHLSSTIALYLYGRSFFLEDRPIDPKQKDAVDYFLGQARRYWLELANRQSQGHLALALKRFGDADTPGEILRSIKERSVEDEEMGMFWRELELSWWWFRAPIETQGIMIEAFDEVAGDAEAVEACKVWLLKQKQTQDWKTTKATADAVYALLLRGSNLLASDAIVEISLAGQKIKPENVEAGTGFYEHRYLGSEVRPEMGTITVKKIDDGVSWGSVHWQYLEDIGKVTPYEGTPLKLKKTLYLKETTKKGPVLKPLAGEAHVGDELVVRIELRVDRDMEYVHLKDGRGSGTEPVNVLSRYRYQDGLAYYESTRDTASHFFIDYLPKGVYVFEYSTRVVHRGRYQTGMAQIQCMYAPEFNSHSASPVIEVR